MNHQARAFQLSFLLHSVIVVLVIVCSTFMGHYKKTVVLDFDLRRAVPQVRKQVDLTPAPVVRTKPAGTPALQKKEQPRMKEESARVPAVPETPPLVKLPEARNLESSPVGQEMQDQGKAAKEGSPGIPGAGAGTGTGMGDAGAGGGPAGTRYVNENYAYIRDKILKNVSYPDIARRKDWQGKVILSFVIAADGTVRDFRIIQSSGYQVLDRSAIQTVRDSAPFPRPPGEAQLVIPITYRLE